MNVVFIRVGCSSYLSLINIKSFYFKATYVYKNTYSLQYLYYIRGRKASSATAIEITKNLSQGNGRGLCSWLRKLYIKQDS